MKQKSILLMLSIFLSMGVMFGQGTYVSISGSVTSSTTGLPVENQELLASSIDSLIITTASAFTDVNGNYTMSLLVSNPNNILIQVTTFDPCNPSISYNQLVTTNPATNVSFSVCTGGSSTCFSDFGYFPGNPLFNEVVFTDFSLGNGITYLWDFGDGNTSTLANPVHQYASPGFYEVCLSIETIDTCFSTFCDFVPAGDSISFPGCDAYFFTQYNPVNYQVDFINLSFANGTILSYFWDFGDGNTSSQQNPSHIYNASGTYSACLTIITSDSCTSTYCEPILIGGAGSCFAEFAYYPNNPVSNPLEIDFYDYSYGNVINWNWTFGDGSTSTLQDPTHTYSAAGIYQVCLLIETIDSCISVFCDSVFVDSSVFPNDCEADFIAEQDSLFGNIVQFTDLSTSNSTIVSYFWEFGDGTTSTQQSPVYAYVSSGFYLVCLTIETIDSCMSTICQPVFIFGGGCSASFTYAAINPVSNPTQISFTDNSIGSVIEWLWDFGDGNVSNLANPVHNYASAGTYTVCLFISTMDSCFNSSCETIQVAGGNSGNSVSGQVIAGQDSISSGTVILMSNLGQTYNTSIVNGSYSFTGIPDGTFIIYAIPNVFLYPTMIPTYYVDALAWVDATEIILSGNSNVTGTDIFLLELLPTTIGPGGISGTIVFSLPSKSYQNTYNESAGNVNLYIMDMNDNLLFHETTDANGFFDFRDLPYNTYKLHVELAGHNTFPAIFTLDENMPTITDIAIEISDGNIVFLSSDMEEENTFDFQIYPNPVKDILYLDLFTESANEINVSIHSVYGQLIRQNVIRSKGGNVNTSINVSDLSEGVYLLRIEHPTKGTQSARFVK